jgi:hypothetical protein
MIKRTNLLIHGIEKSTEIQTEGIDSLFHGIIAEIFPSLEKDMDIQV